MTTTEQKIEIAYCGIDKLFYIKRNGEDIHQQQTRPNETELIEALQSDNWENRFNDMRAGKKVRVSCRIYYEMLGSVPPLKQTANSFYCGEPYSGNTHYYYERDEKTSKIYGQLKTIK